METGVEREMAERGLPDQPSPEGKVAGVDVFSSEPRSFKMDRRSLEATALRDAVSRKLLDFLGAYSDDVLTFGYRDRPVPPNTTLKVVWWDGISCYLHIQEYIIILVCNGKHQNQARDELEAFLGNESENFVAWLWNYLSLQTIASNTPIHCLDETTKSKGDFSDLSNNEENLSHANNIDDLEGHKGWRPSEIASIKVLADRPQQRTHAINSVVQTNNINQTQNGFKMFADTSLISSAKFFSGGEQCLERQNQHWKIAKNSSSALPRQPSHVPKSETVMRNSQAIEDTNRESLCNRSAIPSGPSGNDADAEEAQITEPRGNVWDRLGKPCKENESLLRGLRHCLTRTEKLKPQTEEIQDLKHALIEPYATFSGNNTERSTAFDKGHKRRLVTNSSQRHDLLELNKQHSFEEVDKLQKTRHGDIASGNMSASFSGRQENHLQTKEALQKASGSVPNKCQYLSICNESARVKNNTVKLLKPTCTSASSLCEQKKQSDKVVQSAQKKNTSETTMIQNSVPCSLTSDKIESLQFANGNSEPKPIQTEITDVKLKLQKVEKDMQKLRSKQAALIDSKSKLLSVTVTGFNTSHNSSWHLSLAEVVTEAEFLVLQVCTTTQRRILSQELSLSLIHIVRNHGYEDEKAVLQFVHFAATREALFSHFTKCGPIVKVTLLTDVLTGHPKGEADIIFANKESVDKAILLSGTSFFSRILVVTRKSEMASGSASTQLAAKVQQSCYPPSQKGAFQAHYAYTHFQWKRE
ncbi:hypothetical protein ZIOFF_006700 [Zingiber officinale]|uniref:RRM domain-containing protein n=1 Tax=Zingiber officinale TaxID=94328 RepID=A0A8J5ICB6_ZINOF|nr:hypothetical protein ZIOFF_006700 [Zingiber officinale]